MRRGAIVLLYTNVVIEALQVGCWNAISGGLILETVKACESELYSGKRWEIETPVPPDVSAGFREIHMVTEAGRRDGRLKRHLP